MSRALSVAAAVLLTAAAGAKETPARIQVRTNRFGYECSLVILRTGDSASVTTVLLSDGKVDPALLKDIQTASTKAIPAELAATILARSEELCTRSLAPGQKPWLLVEGQGEPCGLLELRAEGSAELLEFIDPLWDDELLEQATTAMAMRQIALDEEGR